jgi:hypothetical protein
MISREAWMVDTCLHGNRAGTGIRGVPRGGHQHTQVATAFVTRQKMKFEVTCPIASILLGEGQK